MQPLSLLQHFSCRCVCRPLHGYFTCVVVFHVCLHGNALVLHVLHCVAIARMIFLHCVAPHCVATGPEAHFLHLLRVLLGVQILGTDTGIAAKETWIIVEGPRMGLYQNEEQLNLAFAVDGQGKKQHPRGGAFQNYRAAKKFIEVACFSKKEHPEPFVSCFVR